LYRDLLTHKLSDESVHGIVSDAVAHEKEFICEALPVSLIGMNASDMATYIEFVADRLLVQLGHPKLFHVMCPFEFMLTQGLETKANFFENRETSYQKAGARVRPGEDHTFGLDAEF
jgi:ribonucleotide reductase beta subunit family protein with ferritin-like domain